MICRY